METGIEFFFHLVAMERVLVVFLRIQKKSKKGRKQRFAIERVNPLFAEQWRKPQTNGFHVFILFCYRKIVLQLTAVYCNRREVSRQHLKRPVFAM